MIKIDPMSGKHFEGKMITVSSHAEEQARKKLGVSFKQAATFIRDNLRKAQYIGKIVGENGKKCRLFGYNRIAFVLDENDDIVVTVYPRKTCVPELRDSVREIVTKELRKINRKLNATERRITLEKADLKVELAETERRLVRTRSESVKLACQARIAAINEELRLLDEELENMRQERSTFLKGVVTYV